MKTKNVIWELELLTNKKCELKKVGLDLDYNDDNRIEELRKHLDSEIDESPEDQNLTADDITI